LKNVTGQDSCTGRLLGTVIDLIALFKTADNIKTRCE